MPGAREPGWTTSDWDRLGRRLEDRRLELDPRYTNYSLFIEERNAAGFDLNYRLGWDAEHAVRQNRMNISRLTMARYLDPAYGWEPGSCENILNDRGGEKDATFRRLLDAADPKLDPADYVMLWDNRDDDVVSTIWPSDRLPQEEKLRLIRQWLRVPAAGEPGEVREIRRHA